MAENKDTKPEKRAPRVRDLRLSHTDNLDALAEISVSDRSRIDDRFREVVPADFRELLDAEAD